MENRLRYTSGYMARRPHENFDCNAVVFKIPIVWTAELKPSVMALSI